MTVKKILIIEDDRFIGEMYVRSLRRVPYEVDWVVSGTEGLETASRGGYNLVLLDIMLPEMQGQDILRALNLMKDRPKIIVLTNYEQDDESRLAMEQQADGYLIKADITPRKLIDIISRM